MSETETFVWIIGSIFAIAFVAFLIMIPKSGQKKREEAKRHNPKEK